MYGTMLKAQGTRYGPEFNGNISGKGYSQQYEFLQKTPAFLALALPEDFADAMNSGLNESRKDPIVARALGPNVSKEQMMFWMTELSEIFLLDYISSQQDRPRNIDYRWAWYYVDRQRQLKSERVDSKVSHAGIASIKMPDELKGSTKVYLIQKTHTNDNDAGGRRYTNFTKKFDLLEKLAHIKVIIYRQLIHLSKDFQAKGRYITICATHLILTITTLSWSLKIRSRLRTFCRVHATLGNEIRFGSRNVPNERESRRS
jgi:hypothetical protein